MADLDFARVVLEELPVKVHGFSVDDGFGYYTIILNSRLSYEMQKEAYDHELAHILEGDLSKMRDIYRDLDDDMDVNKIESERHK